MNLFERIFTEQSSHHEWYIFGLLYYTTILIYSYHYIIRTILEHFCVKNRNKLTYSLFASLFIDFIFSMHKIPYTYHIIYRIHSRTYTTWCWMPKKIVEFISIIKTSKQANKHKALMNNHFTFYILCHLLHLFFCLFVSSLNVTTYYVLYYTFLFIYLSYYFSTFNFLTFTVRRIRYQIVCDFKF